MTKHSNNEPGSDLRGEQLLAIGKRVVDQARRAGVDTAEALVVSRRELTAKVRLGKPELVQQAGSRAVGLRVIQQGRSAVCYTANFSDAALKAFVEEAVRVAGLAEPDPDVGPPDADALATEIPELDLFDPAVAAVDADRALAMAREAEASARAVDPRITNSEGASCDVACGRQALVTSGGFAGHYQGTYLSLVVEPVADDEGGKKRNGWWWDGRRHLARLASPEAIGEEAARRTVAQLGARKIETGRFPVIFSPEAGAQVLGTLFQLVSGDAAYRNATYLLGREGESIAAPLVTVVDDGLLPGAPGSRPYDGEGLPSRRNLVIDHGIFVGFLCDTYAGRRLGRDSTGNAGRGVGGPPAVTSTNFLLEPGALSVDELIKDTGRGFYVTRMMGFGFNPVTGDFSKGAEGFWIEDGARAFPVSEVTVSSNFDRLLQGIERIADDLDLRSGVASPTFQVAEMTLGGA